VTKAERKEDGRRHTRWRASKSMHA
jgi:hypothetical protein